MKTLAITIALLFATACADNKVIRQVEYETYGFANADEVKNQDIKYSVSWGNVFWGVVFIETIIAPIYFFGYSLYEPDGMKPGVKGAVAVP
jgi:hypothetical protein